MAFKAKVERSPVAQSFPDILRLGSLFSSRGDTMQQQGIVELKFLNWEDYQPRSDIKRPNWFRFENTTIEHDQFENFTNDELLFLIYALSLASFQNENGKTVVSLRRAEIVRGFTETMVLSAIKKLEELQIVKLVTYAPRTGPVRDPAVIRTQSEQHITEQYNTGHNKTKQNRTTFAPAEKLPTPKPKTLGSLAFESYEAAYLTRYKVPPVRNEKTNSLFKQLAKRLGEEAPMVAAFYIGHNSAFYFNSLHSVNLLVRDAEKLRTEWATGRKVTAIIAKETETMDHNQTVVQNYLNESKALEEKNERAVFEENDPTRPRLPSQSSGV